MKEYGQPPDNNPKSAAGILKPPMELIPGTALVHLAMAMRDGAKKYGPYNWREHEVSSSIYVAAAIRHLEQYFNRETFDQKSYVHHLGHAMACCAIVLDAEACNMLIDDRPKYACITDLLHYYMGIIKEEAHEIHEVQKGQ